nr:THO complex subunit 1-like [Leptinotarsa decemlineata]
MTNKKKWIANNTETVYNLLRETPPDGQEFAQIVKNVLSREELWNGWKNESCPEIKKTLPSPTDTSDRKKDCEKRLLGDIIKEAHSQGKFFMGSGELTKLWNQCPNNLEACKGRDFLPSLEEYFSEAIQQIENPAKGDENLLKDGNFGWRALRLLARRSPHFFTYGATILSPLSVYLESMVKKVAHEIPGKENSQESQSQSQNDTELYNILTEEEPASEDLKQNETEEFVDDPIVRRDSKNITLPQLILFSGKVAPDWEKLAVKLGFKPDEIDFFTNENPTREEQARNLLQIWFEDDEDASLENLVYILEGLEMNDAAEVVRSEIPNNMEI